jgi:hypothetical protein
VAQPLAVLSATKSANDDRPAAPTALRPGANRPLIILAPPRPRAVAHTRHGQMVHQESAAMKLEKKSLATALLISLSALLLGLSACQKEEGPAEKAGKEMDKAVDKVGQQIEKAGESVQDAAKSDKK